jgi:hypothetical protein
LKAIEFERLQRQTYTLKVGAPLSFGLLPCNSWLPSTDFAPAVLDLDIAMGEIKVIAPAPSAALTGYDHTVSGLAAATVQAAIDEIVARVVALES